MLNLNELIDQGLVLDYSNKLYKSRIGGTLKKKFFRVHSSVFGDLWDKIELGKVSFKTYIDDYIKSGERLEYVSCMLKKVREDSFTSSQIRINRDLATMAIANMLKIPCAYSVPVLYNNEMYTLSIDFVPYNHTVKNLTEYTGGVFLDTYMDVEEYVAEVMPAIFKKSKNIANDKKYDYVNSQIEILLNEVFLEKHMIGDADSCSDNMAIICPKKGCKSNPFIAPLFDNEFAYSNKLSSTYLIDDVRFLFHHFPQVLDKFLRFSDDSLKSGYNNIRNELSKYIDDMDYVNKITLFIVQNLTSLDMAFKIVAEENQPEMSDEF